MKKTIKPEKLPFRKDSILNFFFIARYKRRLTQVELSKMTGVPPSSISFYENGKYNIPFHLQKLFSVVLNFSKKEKEDYEKFLNKVRVTINKEPNPKSRHKNRIMPKGIKRNRSQKIQHPQVVKTKREKKTFTTEDKNSLKFLNAFFKKGGKRVFNWLLKAYNVD